MGVRRPIRDFLDILDFLGQTVDVPMCNGMVFVSIPVFEIKLVISIPIGFPYGSIFNDQSYLAIDAVHSNVSSKKRTRTNW